MLAATLAFLRHWRILLLLVGVFVLHFALISPKLFIEAYRPSPQFGVEGGGGLSSFPSGHVQWTVSFWGFVALLAWRFAPERWRPAVLVAYPVLVASAMLGRIELGKHWPVDTVAGLIAGVIALNLVIASQIWLLPSPQPATGPNPRSHSPERIAHTPRPQSRRDFVG
jgi:undecaprenyl-diphosphatase